MENEAGHTTTAGWELGVRTTVPVPAEEAWDYLVGRGLDVWLGDTVLGNKGESYETSDGVHGVVRSFHPLDRVRVTWRRAGDTRDSTVQVEVVPAASGTTIAFHHDHLADAAEREAMLAHWADVADRVAADLGR